MKISGSVQFDGVSASALRVIENFQSKHTGLHLTAGSTPGTFSVFGESFEKLALLTRLAAELESERHS